MLSYLRQFMHMCHNYLIENHKCTDKHTVFFTCLNENAKTEDRRWFDKLAHNFVYANFKHHVETGVYMLLSAYLLLPPPPSCPLFFPAPALLAAAAAA
jgi:hypothetical protein